MFQWLCLSVGLMGIVCRLMDRMENKGGSKGAKEVKDGGDEGGGGAAAPTDDAGMLLTAKLKAQKESGARLSVGHKVPTLPDGVTLRDDPMTKTIAFLNSMPKLT